MTTKLPIRKVLVRIPEMPAELHREVKAKAVLRGMKIGDYIIKVLKEHVKKGR